MIEYSHAQAWAFIREASSYRDAAELEAHFARTLSAFGFDRFMSLLVAPAAARTPGVARTDPRHWPRALASRNVDNWNAYFMEQGYFPVDPCGRWVDAGRPSFSWSEARGWLERQSDQPALTRELWGDASSGGMNEGLIVTADAPDGKIVVTRMMTAAKSIRPADRPVLDAVVVIFATYRHRLEDQAHDRPLNNVLTAREAECLRWIGQGMTDPQIAETLGISYKTVNFHIENAKRKLGARTRLAAFQRAVQIDALT